MEPWHFPGCPAPPDWSLDWDMLLGRCASLGALAGTPQNPVFHGEGDVLTHTRLVAEALTRLEEWRALPAGDRSLLFAAALLHDVAKPRCTQVAADGAIRSPGHARVGAQLAQELLWHGDGLDTPPPFAARTAITRLVRQHGLPLWFFEKDDPVRAVIEASLAVRLDHVALLAEADVRGRVCADRRELLDRVAYFRAFCAEQGCLSAPYTFASDHSRFVYCHSAHTDPTYAAYDDTTSEVVLLAGLPGAGKDSWIARERAGWPVVSLDRLRGELGIAPTDGQGAVVHAAREQARVYLRRQESFVWNATNLTRALRRQLIELFSAYHARTTIVYLDAQRATILRRNASRTKPVPETVIERMLRQLEVPDLREAQHVECLAEDAVTA